MTLMQDRKATKTMVTLCIFYLDCTSVNILEQLGNYNWTYCIKICDIDLTLIGHNSSKVLR